MILLLARDQASKVKLESSIENSNKGRVVLEIQGHLKKKKLGSLL
jgi:hypothetical protein